MLVILAERHAAKKRHIEETRRFIVYSLDHTIASATGDADKFIVLFDLSGMCLRLFKWPPVGVWPTVVSVCCVSAWAQESQVEQVASPLPLRRRVWVQQLRLQGAAQLLRPAAGAPLTITNLLISAVAPATEWHLFRGMAMSCSNAPSATCLNPGG